MILVTCFCFSDCSTLFYFIIFPLCFFLTCLSVVNIEFLKACVVQPKSEIDLQFETTDLNNFWGYLSAAALCVTTFGTIALMSGFFLKPDATIDDYLSNVIPLFGGFLTILGVSEVCFALLANLTFCYLFSGKTLSTWKT